MNTCETCKHWERDGSMNRGKRMCNNTGIDAKMDIDGGDCNDVLYTTPDFSCSEFSPIAEQGIPPVFKPSKIEKGNFLHVYDPAQIALIVRAVSLAHSYEAVAKAAMELSCPSSPEEWEKFHDTLRNLNALKKELGYK